MSRLQDLVGRNKQAAPGLPAWLDRPAMLGIVSTDPTTVQRQRFTNMFAFASAANILTHLLMYAFNGAGELAPLTLGPGPVAMEIQRDEPWPAELRHNAERVDAFTIRYVGASFWQAFHQATVGKPDLPLPK